MNGGRVDPSTAANPERTLRRRSKWRQRANMAKQLSALAPMLAVTWWVFHETFSREQANALTLVIAGLSLAVWSLISESRFKPYQITVVPNWDAIFDAYKLWPEGDVNSRRQWVNARFSETDDDEGERLWLLHHGFRITFLSRSLAYAHDIDRFQSRSWRGGLNFCLFKLSGFADEPVFLRPGRVNLRFEPAFGGWAMSISTPDLRTSRRNEHPLLWWDRLVWLPPSLFDLLDDGIGSWRKVADDVRLAGWEMALPGDDGSSLEHRFCNVHVREI